MSEELTIDEITRLRARMTSGNFDSYVYAPEAIDYLLAKLDEMQNIVREIADDYMADTINVHGARFRNAMAKFEAAKEIAAALAQHHGTQGE